MLVLDEIIVALRLQQLDGRGARRRSRAKRALTCTSVADRSRRDRRADRARRISSPR